MDLDTEIEDLKFQRDVLKQELDFYREMDAKKISDRSKMMKSRVLAVIGLSAGLSFSMGVASFIIPDIVKYLLSNPLALFLIVLALSGFTVLVFFNVTEKKDDDSFASIDKYMPFSKGKKYDGRADKAIEDAVQQGEQNRFLTPEQVVLAFKKAEEERQHLLNHPFEAYVKGLVSNLDEHIKISDTKASKLLDTGTMYLRRGLYFYIASIVFWQCWGHWVAFNALVISGIVSCSIAFVVVEFLAAWFLKQYRSFIDSSVSYMRVRSHFNRYMLSYFAVREFPSESPEDVVARAELVRILSEEIKWPELKDINANDFNYMLESMGALNSTFEKMKGLFGSKKPEASGE